MNFGAADVPALLRDFGVNVTVGATTTKGIVDRADRPVLESDGTAAVTGRYVTVTVQTGSLPGLAVGGTITVDGQALRVAGVHVLEDGELTEVLVAKS